MSEYYVVTGKANVVLDEADIIGPAVVSYIILYCDDRT